jgi:hypothetical protein
MAFLRDVAQTCCFWEPIAESGHSSGSKATDYKDRNEIVMMRNYHFLVLANQQVGNAK